MFTALFTIFIYILSFIYFVSEFRKYLNFHFFNKILIITVTNNIKDFRPCFLIKRGLCYCNELLSSMVSL